MEEDGVTLSRRRSGGGAVYHNLGMIFFINFHLFFIHKKGNTCFSFLIPVFGAEPPLNAKNTNNQIILKGLDILNLKAEVSGRNDILLDGKKVIKTKYNEIFLTKCRFLDLLIK